MTPFPPSPFPPFPPFPPVIAADGSKIFNKMPLPLHCLRVLFFLVASDLPVSRGQRDFHGPCGHRGCRSPGPSWSLRSSRLLWSFWSSWFCHERFCSVSVSVVIVLKSLFSSCDPHGSYGPCHRDPCRSRCDPCSLVVVAAVVVLVVFVFPLSSLSWLSWSLRSCGPCDHGDLLLLVVLSSWTFYFLWSSW